MTKHLLTGSSTTGAGNWTLPESADVDAIRQSLRLAMENGEILQVAVVVQKDPTIQGELLLNGKVLEQAVVVDLAQVKRASGK